MKAWLVNGILLFACTRSLIAGEPDSKGIEFFENKIRPVLIDKCYSCHSQESKKSKGSLFLDTKSALLEGGESGPVFVPGKPKESLLLRVLQYEEGQYHMPPKGKLPDEVIANFAKWIEMGAPDPRDGKQSSIGINWSEAQKFWSFQPIQKPSLPTLKTESGIKSDIDRFIRAKLEENNLKSAPLADKVTLIRRATFDLIGLPPTPEEIDSFLKDESPDAFTKVIDRLLQSPHYGEHQARFWLDIARYAEDQAHTFAVKPYSEAYRYRDWVIDAFNRDLPYNQFVKLQIAADFLETNNPNAIQDRSALGFFGLGAQYYKNSDKGKAEADELDDRVDTLCRGFLGLTVSCARCHDHKFDPIPTQDYYSIAGVFWSCKLSEVSLVPKEVEDRYQTALKKVQSADKSMKDFLKTERDQLSLEQVKDFDKYFLAAWKLESQRLEKPNLSSTQIAKEEKLDPNVIDRFVKFMSAKGSNTPIGDAWRRVGPNKKAEVTPEIQKAANEAEEYVASILKNPPTATKATGTDKMKNDLINSLYAEKGVFAIPEKDLIAKLNEDKKKSFQQLKQTHDDLKKGMPSTPPSAHGIAEANPVDLNVYVRGNPTKQGDLAPRRFLRILAGENPQKFTKGSGRLELAEAIADPKNPLTPRVIVNRIWQQHFGRGIVGTPSNFGQLGERPTHPELLDYLASKFIESGWSIKKLHKEIMLSSTYQLSSSLDERNLQIDADNRYLWRMTRQRLRVESFRDSLLAVSGQLDRVFGGATTDLNSPNNVRRTVYGKISRHDLTPLLRLFDFPDANITSEKRTETTVPQQQLFVLNSPFFVNQAKAFAQRVQKEAKTDNERIRRAYQLAYGRSPEETEIQIGLEFLTTKDSLDETENNKLTRWERYTQVLLASNEFLYVD
jgi:hypothetical protein